MLLVIFDFASNAMHKESIKHQLIICIYFCFRSQTCPHCREKVTRDKIHRAYFSIKDETSSNISQSSSSNISQSLLEEKIANLEFQNLLKDKNIKNFVSKTKVLKKQNAELRQEVRNVESEMNKKNNIIYELNEKIKHLNETSSQYEVLKEEFSKTKKKLDGLKRYICVYVYALNSFNVIKCL